MIDDEKIIELFFERSEQGIRELDMKYGKICHNLSYNIVNSRRDAEECVNDAYYDMYVAEFEYDGIEYEIVAEQMEAEEIVKVVSSIIYGEEVFVDK